MRFIFNVVFISVSSFLITSQLLANPVVDPNTEERWRKNAMGDPRKWDPNLGQISSPVVRNWSWDYSDLQKAAGKWLDSQSEADGVECDKFADKLMADYKDRVEAYVVASELANLRGNKDRAIELMRLVAEKFTDRGTIDARMPLPLFAHFHIAAYAKQAGDLVTARQEYEKALTEILTDAKRREKYAVTAAICHLYIAEIDVAKTGKTDALSQRIKLIRELKPFEQADMIQFFADSDTPFNTVVKWADYQQVKKTKGAEASRSKCKQPDELVDLFIENHLVPSGLNGGHMLVGNEKAIDILTQRMMNNSKSEFDKGSISLWRGGLCEYQKKYTEAEKYYSILQQEESFLSPCGGAGLVRCKKLQGKNDEAESLRNQLKQKYPSIKFKDKPKTKMKAF